MRESECMVKERIYELVKEFKMLSKDLVNLVKKEGMDVKIYMFFVIFDEVNKLCLMVKGVGKLVIVKLVLKV